ncbi:hypothetical protein BGX24_002659 [Mortierella sp. AD032]|nr:hypothetical protein BGX24_002659 [Mortierella sp. AD032]
MTLSIFDIPEVADLIASCLSPQDLANCIRVNKTWNTIFVRYLWRTVPPLAVLKTTCEDRYGHEFFRLAIRDDYLSTQEQQQRDTIQGISSGNSNKSSESLSFLSRYGPWIRHLTLGQHHLKGRPKPQPPRIFQPTSAPFNNGEQASASLTTSATAAISFLSIFETDVNPVGLVAEPIEQDLLLHILNQCPNLTFLRLESWEGGDEQLEFWKKIAREVLPRLVEFSVKFSFSNLASSRTGEGDGLERNRPITKSSAPRVLATGCSGKLERLQIPCIVQCEGSVSSTTISGQVQSAEDAKKDVEKEEELLIGLKFLGSSALNDNGSWSGWKRFLKRCVNLETLQINTLDSGWSQVLEECTFLKRLRISLADVSVICLLTDILRAGGLPNLDDIDIYCLFHRESSNHPVTDDHIASLLAAGNRKGWRNVQVPTLKTRSAEALIQHCTTLESVHVKNTPGLTSAIMRQILTSSPRLHTFVVLDYGEYEPSIASHFMAEDFIDLNPDTGVLRPWACESTLTVFSAKILGIPRPDVTLTHYGLPRADVRGVQVLQETHPGQSHDLQVRIYERLARFAHLSTLGLGHDDRDTTGEEVENANGDCVLCDYDFQYECLSFSMDSGLRILERLKELKRLVVFRMATRIGLEEVKWMSSVWPNMDRLEGLDADTKGGEEAVAHTWLTEACSRIKSLPWSP